MCGIVGFVDFDSTLNKEVLVKMTDSLSYRGPDDSGHWLANTANATIGLGHRRLSILELSPLGHQPMEYLQFRVVFNGEIYNFKEIRADLLKLGYTFESNSDTEVILKSFHRWGPSCVGRFIGMFAIVIYDSDKQSLWLFRDRAGVKPLYYYHEQGVFLFASELKAFHEYPKFNKNLNQNALQLFLQLGYIPAPNSIFKNTYKLQPGYYIELKLAGKETKLSKYWDVLDYYNRPKLKMSFEDACDETEKILISAFRYRMVSDVPVGVFLSGGYDSTAVAAILQAHAGRQVDTFSIGFDEPRYNEAPHARAIANYLGTRHNEQYCSINEAKKILPELPTIWDEPFGDGSAIPTVLVSRLANKYVKVALSADAGDEIFAGYEKYPLFLKNFHRIARIPSVARDILARVPYERLRLLFLGAYNAEARLSKLSSVLLTRDMLEFNLAASKTFVEKELRQMLLHYSNNLLPTSFTDHVNSAYNNDLETLLAIDFKTYMVDDILTKVDRATMCTSLEGREPLLDHRIIEFVAQLPSEYKLTVDGKSKYLLREIVHKYVPETMMNRPKMGFSAPIETWLKADMKYLVEYYFDEQRVKQAGVLNPQVTNALKKNFFDGKKFNFNRLWYVLVFNMWYEKWMN
ncbi:MAG: asparagine synthase (glutamine-hydrolyzing) [Cyclobacteriaceae bacterium]